MGLILDSSVVIAGERKRFTAGESLIHLRTQIGPQDIALSTVSVVELEHGIWRAKDAAQGEMRRRFFEELFALIPVYPLTLAIARRAARIDGEARRQGIVVPFQDLVIGATALEFDYGVATVNGRHFSLIPNLRVTQI